MHVHNCYSFKEERKNSKTRFHSAQLDYLLKLYIFHVRNPKKWILSSNLCTLTKNNGHGPQNSFKT